MTASSADTRLILIIQAMAERRMAGGRSVTMWIAVRGATMRHESWVDCSKDWISPQRRSVKGIEKHHLFPKDYLEAKLGIKDVRRTNQVANFALVEWSDNIDISNKAPEVYWPEQIADKRLEGNRLTRQEGWHALPPDWATAEYNEFLVRRRRLIAKVIREGFQQLSDPNYVPDLSTEDQLRAEPIDLPSFEELVISGTIQLAPYSLPQMPTSQSMPRCSTTGTLRSAITPTRTWTEPPTPPGLTPAQAGPSGKFSSATTVTHGPWPTSALRRSVPPAWRLQPAKHDFGRVRLGQTRAASGATRMCAIARRSGAIDPWHRS
jgi:hypothetical protein